LNVSGLKKWNRVHFPSVLTKGKAYNAIVLDATTCRLYVRLWVIGGMHGYHNNNFALMSYTLDYAQELERGWVR